MIAWTGSLAFDKPSIPSGLWIVPRPTITPGENACQTAPLTLKSRVSHANHFQRLSGKCPSGKNRSESSIQPMNRTHTQEVSQARASPAGTVSGCARRA